MSCPFAALEGVFSNRYVVGAVGVGAAVWVATTAWSATKQRRQAQAKQARREAQKKGVVYLYQWPRTGRLHSLSTFCTIVETYLRLTGTPHEVVDVISSDMSPTERLPYIELDGVGTADSEFIMERLAKDLGHGAAPASKLDQATSTLLMRTLNQSTRLHMARWLWVDNTSVMRDEFTSAGKAFGTPSLVVTFLCRTSRKKSISLLNAEGQGDLSDTEYHRKFLDDIKAVEAILAGFADGKVQLSQAAIATAYTYLAYLSIAPACPAINHMKNSAVLKRFLASTDRMAFPDSSTRVPHRGALPEA